MENVPIFEAPRTPSPVSSHGDDIGLGIDIHEPSAQQSPFRYDPRNLSPEHVRRGPPIKTGMLSPDFTPSLSAKTPTSVDTPMTGQAMLGDEDEEVDGTPTSPFNFTTQQYTVARSPGGAKGEMGRRKGHKYKHSSISHQIFQPPAPRPPIQLPTSLPMPTRKEVQHSLTSEQKSRLAWCLCHFVVAAYVQWAAHGSMAMTALSRLLFFDASGAVICVFVDMMGNFEVWKRSSLRHPFGLERADVLAGFGMAVFIAFMGLDVLSHGIEHALEHQGDHVPHNAHGHGRASAGSVDLAAITSIIATLVSSVLLKNHERIGRAMRFQLIPGGGRIFGNPSHFMTLTCSVLLLLLPFLSSHVYTIVDTALSAGVAIMMIAFGARLGTSLASMLLMSYSGPGAVGDVQGIMAEIEADPLVAGIEEARFWQVHYGMGMANLKVRHRCNEYGDDLSKLRDKLTRVIWTRLGGDGSNGVHWEITTQLVLERT